MKRFIALGMAVTLCFCGNTGSLGQDNSGMPESVTPQATSGQELLLKARQALSKFDVPVAQSYVDEAKQLGNIELRHDSIAKIESMIARHGELAQMARTGNITDYNRGAALFLLEQAEGLIQYRDFTTAESLVLKAKQFPVQYEAGDKTPDNISQLLAAVRGTSSVSQQNIELAKSEAAKLLSRAQLAYDQDRFDEASQLVAEVKALEIPTSAFSGEAILPWELELKIRNAMSRHQPVENNIVEAAAPVAGDIQQALYNPETDQTRNLPASFDNLDTEEFVVPNSRGKQLFDSGMYALENEDNRRALEYFRLAWQYEDQLDIATRGQLKEKLAQLQRTLPTPQPQEAADEFEAITGVDKALREKVQSEVMRERAIAEQMMSEKNPRGALEHLQLLREKVAESALDEVSRRQLTSALDRNINDISDYITTNLTQIETEEYNQVRLEEVETSRQRRYDIERKIADLVENFNDLVDEERFPEAKMVAEQANILAPEMEVVQAMIAKARIMYRVDQNRRIADAKANHFETSMAAADRAATGGADLYEPIRFTEDRTRWENITARRKAMVEDNQYGSELEREIYYRLKNEKIQYEFNRTPLTEALEILGARAGVNIIPDSRALSLENVAPDQPVDMRLTTPISVESALDIMLGNLDLVYIVEDEVVKVTSKEVQQREQSFKTYYVGDLVVPIPNFQTGLQNTFISPMNAHNSWGRQNMGMNSGNVPMVVNMPEDGTTPISTAAMAQQIPNNPFGGNAGFGGVPGGGFGGPNSGSPLMNQFGPASIGNPGGITEADFNDLIELIEETINPDSWETNGGTGRMAPFASNLSLVVTATQAVQDEIGNLLTRLRQLNDVQIVIEVRFITLNDDFFERMGVDFDFNIEDNSGLPANTFFPDTVGDSTISGVQNGVNNAPTGNNDISFNQDSFTSAVPLFGAPDLGTAANFGFAILSDIEVFFLIQAAKGDTRTNVVQAPVVTMFNGQSATVNDFSLNPFVTQIIPVVGDFAAAQQPIISLLPEGTQLNVQALVSPDRRFVRMTMVPFFSQIESVSTFTFEGSRTERVDNRTDLGDVIDLFDGDSDTAGTGEEFEVIEEGTTVQLPVLAVTNVSTTVSVPDGGTVLLGGIKRMSEGRIERGVPMLSNIPYVNRLFKNVAIGRETQSLMMMVTPRIIITEEEEIDQTGINSRAGN